MKNNKYLWLENSTPERLANQLADDIAMQVNLAIKAKGFATMALSGGATPMLMFEALSKCEIAWDKVVITLVDERCVDEQHVLSNAKFIKTKLLDVLPEQPKFIPLYYSELENVDDIFFKVIANYCEATGSEIDNLAALDVVVLGMGGDGHTASYFPDADNIDLLIDPDTQEYLFSSESVSTQVPRITWSLRMLLNTQMLALHFTGKAKKEVFKRAAEKGDISEIPVRTAIFQDSARLKVYYAD
ncbi:MAG: 6-phosphogluconolactonase [Acidiferrobacterales bacterium]|nr:6-phosphogluconolactonase [Acidiferrobacterales bacterium]